jgi:hypothetical protein
MGNNFMNGMYPYQNPYMPKPNNSGINWTQGIEGAKAFGLQPKESIVLLDSEADNIMYIKVCDDIGRCTLRVFEYSEVTNKMSNNMDMSEYVKKSELESLLNDMLGGTKNEQTVSRTTY